MVRRLLACVVSGAMGGLVSSVTAWGFGVLGVSRALEYAMTPALTWGWLWPRLALGGAWGVLFLLPFWTQQPWRKAAVVSLAPTAYMLFKGFPDLGLGLYGLGAGQGAPFVEALFNLIWAVAAVGFLMASQVGSGPAARTGTMGARSRRPMRPRTPKA